MICVTSLTIYLLLQLVVSMENDNYALVKCGRKGGKFAVVPKLLICLAFGYLGFTHKKWLLLTQYKCMACTKYIH